MNRTPDHGSPTLYHLRSDVQRSGFTFVLAASLTVAVMASYWILWGIYGDDEINRAFRTLFLITCVFNGTIVGQTMIAWLEDRRLYRKVAALDKTGERS